MLALEVNEREYIYLFDEEGKPVGKFFVQKVPKHSKKIKVLLDLDEKINILSERVLRKGQVK